MQGAASAIPKPMTSILTAQHVIHNIPTNENSGENSGYLFCENVFRRVRHVAKKAFGVLGTLKITEDGIEEEVGVDAAIIPINLYESPSPKDVLSPKIFDNSCDLMYEIIEKVGFKTQKTQGKVVNVDYNANFGDLRGGQCLLVEMLLGTKLSQFSHKGDSGSLVIRQVENKQIEAIGILSMGIPMWKSPEGETFSDVAVIVLLKNCVQAIREKFGKQLNLDENWDTNVVRPLQLNE